MTSDDEHDSPRAHGPSSSLSRPARFNFDDAFSDTDDQDESFEFSPAAIRAELQKSLSQDSTHGESTWVPDHDLNDLLSKIGYANGGEADPDASVSTFDIDTGYPHGLSLPTQQPYSPEFGTTSYPSEDDVQSFDEVTLASELSSVNLQSPQPDPHETPEQHSYEESRHGEYPAVQIDVSDDHSIPAVVHVGTPLSHTPVRSLSPSTPPHDGQISPATSTGSNPLTPQSSQSASVPSLPMPASSSLPTPSSARSDASVSSTSSSKHRPSRSVGPSMLDKVISKTRPTFLPPKPRAEDRKHLADWEQMMKRSRVAGESGQDGLFVSSTIVNQSSLLIFVWCSIIGLSNDFCAL